MSLRGRYAIITRTYNIIISASRDQFVCSFRFIFLFSQQQDATRCPRRRRVSRGITRVRYDSPDHRFRRFAVCARIRVIWIVTYACVFNPCVCVCESVQYTQAHLQTRLDRRRPHTRLHCFHVQSPSDLQLLYISYIILCTATPPGIYIYACPAANSVWFSQNILYDVYTVCVSWRLKIRVHALLLQRSRDYGRVYFPNEKYEMI